MLWGYNGSRVFFFTGVCLFSWGHGQEKSLFWVKKIFAADFLEEIKKDVLSEEQRILKSFPSCGDGGTGLGTKSLTSRFQYFNLFEWNYPWVSFLKEEVVKGVSVLGEDLGYSKVYGKAWANVMRKGEKIRPHTHTVFPDYLSAHLTVASEKTSTFYRHPYNPKLTHVEPNEPGKLTIFPSHFPHWTSTYLGGKERISLAADFFTELHFDSFIFDVKPNGPCRLA